MNTFDLEYQQLLKKILEDGVQELNNRTEKQVKIHQGGFTSFNLRPSEHFPIVSLRDINIKHFVAEIIWFLSASQDLNLLRKYTKGWNMFSDYDNPDKVSNSYGYMWRKHFGRDQLLLAIEDLQRDPSSRQCVVMGWNPTEDAMGTTKKPNVPCVPMFLLNIIQGELNLSTFWRSEDIYFGLPHDIAGFALLQSIIAQKLGVKTGYLHHLINHAHIYENQFKNCEIMCQREVKQEPIRLELPSDTFDRASTWNETLVDEILENLEKQYTPQKKLKHVKIAV